MDKENKEKILDVEKKQLSELDTLNSNILFINAGLKSIVRSFYNVGKVLSELKENCLFKAKGYKNFSEFTKAEFSLSSAQSYKLVNIYNKFPSSKYYDFTFSQLSEMLSLPDNKIDEISSDMTIKEIREVKKEIKKDVDKIIKKKDRIEFGEQVNIVDVVPEDEKSDVEELVNVANEIEHLETANKVLKNRKEALEVKHENLKKINRDKLEEISNLKSRLELAKSSMDNLIKRDNDKINKLESDNADLVSKIYDLQKENEKIKKENEKLKKENEKIKKEKEKMRKELLQVDKDKPKDLPS